MTVTTESVCVRRAIFQKCRTEPKATWSFHEKGIKAAAELGTTKLLKSSKVFLVHASGVASGFSICWLVVHSFNHRIRK